MLSIKQTANVPNDNGRTPVISARKLSVLAALAAAALSSQAALAQISDDVVKIGVLTDMNWPGLYADRPGLGDRGPNGGRRFRRQGAGEADQRDRRRSSTP